MLVAECGAVALRWGAVAPRGTEPQGGGSDSAAPGGGVMCVRVRMRGCARYVRKMLANPFVERASGRYGLEIRRQYYCTASFPLPESLYLVTEFHFLPCHFQYLVMVQVGSFYLQS